MQSTGYTSNWEIALTFQKLMQKQMTLLGFGTRMIGLGHSLEILPQLLSQALSPISGRQHPTSSWGGADGCPSPSVLGLLQYGGLGRRSILGALTRRPRSPV